MARPLVFVSYSDQDKAQQEKLLAQLKVLDRAAELIDWWSVDRLAIGSDWQNEIEVMYDG